MASPEHVSPLAGGSAGKGLQATATGHALLRGLALGTGHSLCGLPPWIKGQFVRQHRQTFSCRLQGVPECPHHRPGWHRCLNRAAMVAVPAQAELPSKDEVLPEQDLAI